MDIWRKRSGEVINQGDKEDRTKDRALGDTRADTEGFTEVVADVDASSAIS